MNLSTEKKIMDLWLPGGRGRDWELGIMDANSRSWNGFTMRSCCVALRTMSRYLHRNRTMGGKIMYTCMCNWVLMLYSGEKKNVCLAAGPSPFTFRT